MNETELRELLADRASAVVGASDRYAGVRQRITTRKRARLASGAAAIVLVLAGVAAVVPRLGDGRAETVASLGWAARGELRNNPDVAEMVAEYDGATLLFAGTSENRMTPGRPLRWAVLETRDGVLLLRLDGDSYQEVARAQPLKGAQSVAFTGTYDGAPRDGYVVALLAPGLERAQLTGAGTWGPAGEGLVTLQFFRQDPDQLRVELYTSSLVGTEAPVGRFVIPEPPPTVARDALAGADPRALGWEPRVYEQPVGFGCHLAVFCGQLDAEQFGVLFARPENGGTVTVEFVVYRANGGWGAMTEVLPTPVEVVTQRNPREDVADPHVFLLARPGVTRFRVEHGGESQEVFANDGWAWTPINDSGGGTVTAFQDTRVVGSGTF